MLKTLDASVRGDKATLLARLIAVEKQLGKEAAEQRELEARHAARLDGLDASGSSHLAGPVVNPTTKERWPDTC